MNKPPFRCGRVALIGPPNAGKSTLLNTFLGRKLSIVSPLPQTTRNRITGILSDRDAQVIFIDTPGIYQQRGGTHRLMLRAAWDALDGADVPAVIVDADLYARKAEFLVNDLAPLRAPVAAEKRPVFVIANKVDLLGDKSRLLPLLASLHELWPAAGLFPVSAADGEGLPELLAAVKLALPEGPPCFPEDLFSTAPLRFMVAEIVREKLFLTLRQELPYFTSVDIEAWEEDDESGAVEIHAVINVAKSTHKAMVIGRAGRNIKQAGQAARLEIARLLGRKTHLRLWVKVRTGRADEAEFLRSFGLVPEAEL
ncbi:MAG: GTPase Era [Desulfovibrio sp.]|jgi:GTP-binding protein Era|nr:GTPase Era [Desulfovibrio sp.]